MFRRWRTSRPPRLTTAEIDLAARRATFPGPDLPDDHNEQIGWEVYPAASGLSTPEVDRLILRVERNASELERAHAILSDQFLGAMAIAYGALVGYWSVDSVGSRAVLSIMAIAMTGVGVRASRSRKRVRRQLNALEGRRELYQRRRLEVAGQTKP